VANEISCIYLISAFTTSYHFQDVRRFMIIVSICYFMQL